MDLSLPEKYRHGYGLSLERLKEVHAYWDRYTDTDVAGWIAYYSDCFGEFHVRFLPDTVYYLDIDPYLNNQKAAKILDHKCYYKRFFPLLKQPETIAYRICDEWYDENYNFIDIDEVFRLCSFDKVIIKPAVGYCGGTGIRVFEKNSRDLYSYLPRLRTDTVIQKYVKQSRALRALHKQSVNTIRVISFFSKGKTKILSSVVRMGKEAQEVDNISAGGISCGIRPDGTLKAYGFDKNGRRYRYAPGGILFENHVIPGLSQILEAVKEHHRLLPHFRLISWDFAIDSHDEPVFIEFNLCGGELDFHQMNHGPLFGKLTDSILEEVYYRRKQ